MKMTRTDQNSDVKNIRTNFLQVYNLYNCNYTLPCYPRKMVLKARKLTLKSQNHKRIHDGEKEQ